MNQKGRKRASERVKKNYWNQNKMREHLTIFHIQISQHKEKENKRELSGKEVKKQWSYANMVNNNKPRNMNNKGKWWRQKKKHNHRECVEKENDENRSNKKLVEETVYSNNTQPVSKNVAQHTYTEREKKKHIPYIGMKMYKGRNGILAKKSQNKEEKKTTPNRIEKGLIFSEPQNIEIYSSCSTFCCCLSKDIRFQFDVLTVDVIFFSLLILVDSISFVLMFDPKTLCLLTLSLCCYRCHCNTWWLKTLILSTYRSIAL